MALRTRSKSFWQKMPAHSAESTHQTVVLLVCKVMLRRLAIAVSLLTVAAPALAMQHVTLRNGQEIDCAHLAAIDAAHTRLYTDAGEANYEDLLTTEITSIEVRPDPPPAALMPTPHALASAPAPADIPTLVTHAGTAHNIDTALLAAVIHVESAGNAHAVSRVGARGLMQLMPGTAKQLGVTDAFRADQNIDGGTAYLDTLLTRYGNDVVKAVAAYNAGPAAVDRYHGVPPFRETRAYVNRVVREFNRLVTARAAAERASATTALATIQIR
jgi:soluble lytic murein transglycosylase-like protein